MFMAFWNKKIISLSDRYFGLDISDLSVKVFQLEKNGRFDRVRSFGAKEMKSGFLDNGKIINREKIIEVIKEAIASAGPRKINTKKVICSVPESKVFLRTISIPKISEEEAAEAVKWEIEASIPLSVEQVYYDWQFLNQENGKQNVLTVAVSKETVDELVSLMSECGLSVYGLEMESIATSRSLVADCGKEEVCLIVDLGGEKTSFIIVKNSIPYFTSSIPFSSSGITEALSSSLGISREEAERIKITQGIERSLENDPILGAVFPLLENLAVEIEKTIDFYRSVSKCYTDKCSLDINKIIVSGGGSNMKGLVPYFTTRLGKEVVLGNPWINLNLGRNLPPISRDDSARYATAVGLAMRGIDLEIL
jgi:type IV pilus assembly protein PilM